MAEHHEPQAESIAELATKDAWPPYRVGNSEHIHALGVIASVFNLLEFNFRTLFNLYLRIPSPIAYTLFAKISNEMRLDLINRSLAYSIHPETTKPDLDSRAGFRHREWQKCWRLIKPDQKCGAKLWWGEGYIA
jgi:hypothetical protein